MADHAQWDERQGRVLLYRLARERYTDRVLLAWSRADEGVADPRWRALATLPERWTAPVFPLKAADFLARGLAKGPGARRRDARRRNGVGGGRLSGRRRRACRHRGRRRADGLALHCIGASHELGAHPPLEGEGREHRRQVYAACVRAGWGEPFLRQIHPTPPPRYRSASTLPLQGRVTRQSQLIPYHRNLF